MACSAPKEQTKSPFTIVEREVDINAVIEIENCAKWYLDFEDIKRAVVFEQHIICVGSYGGFLSFNIENLERDTIFEKSLNTDFYTNISVVNDTLYTEKFDELYYWHQAEWRKYAHPLPIKYFEVLFEDEEHIAYPTCMGEFGALLFIYEKKSGITRANPSGCPSTIMKTRGGLFVGTKLYHMMGSSALYEIRDIEKLQKVPDSIRFFSGMFDRDERLNFLLDTSDAVKNNHHFITRSSYPSPIITTSFVFNGKLYHFTDRHGYRRPPVLHLATLEDDSLVIFDSLTSTVPDKSIQFGSSTLSNRYGGFTFIRNDTIYLVNLSSRHDGYNGPQASEYDQYLKTDSSIKPAQIASYTDNLNYDDYTTKVGHAEKEIEFDYHGWKIRGMEGNNMDGVFASNRSGNNKLKFSASPLI